MTVLTLCKDSDDCWEHQISGVFDILSLGNILHDCPLGYPYLPANLYTGHHPGSNQFIRRILSNLKHLAKFLDRDEIGIAFKHRRHRLRDMDLFVRGNKQLMSGRLSTSLLYSYYAGWAKDNGYRPLSNRPFVSDLRRRFEIKPDCKKGNVIIGLGLANNFEPCPDEKLPWD